MRYLALLVVMGCGGGDERAAVLPSDGTGGADGGALAAGGRESAGGSGAGGHDCADVVSDDCLRACEEDGDCPDSEICVDTMQAGECAPGVEPCQVKVCRPTCTNGDECPDGSCHGFAGSTCQVTCDRDTRWACAHPIICSWTTAGHCER